MQGDYQGELLRLKSDVNRMGDKLRSIAGRIAQVDELRQAVAFFKTGEAAKAAVGDWKEF